MVKTKMLQVLIIFVCLVGCEFTHFHTDSTKQDNSKTAYDLYVSGNHLYHNGNYDEAIRAFEKSVQQDPDYYYARINLGVTMARIRKYKQAVEQFTFCIHEKWSSDADRFVFYFNRALAAKESKDEKSAQRDRKILEKLDPVRAESLQNSTDYILMDTFYSQRRNETDKNKLFNDHKVSIIKGKIIVRRIADHGNNAEEYEAMGLIEGTLKDVSGVLTDYRSYPEFMPNVKEILIRESTPEGHIVDHKLELPMGVMKKYRLKLWSKSEANRIQLFWKKIPWPGLKLKDTIVDSYGQWILEDFPAKDNVILAYYRVYTHPGKVPFGTGWIVDILTKESLPNIIKGTRHQVKQITK